MSLDISNPSFEEFRSQIQLILDNPPTWMGAAHLIIKMYLDQIPNDKIYHKEYSYDNIKIIIHCTQLSNRLIVEPIKRYYLS